MSTKTNIISRPPVVAIVGHIDHGKSSLLDYIRKTNVVAGEAGGITQHLSAYEAVKETPAGVRTITFLDTPGHAAFTAMRSRGLSAADIAILIVSAEEGVKPQTLEAIKLIEESKIPYIVALTKIDKESANIERAKNSLLENGVYLEGLGGTIPWVGISSKTGVGVPELLDLVLLTADIAELSYDSKAAPVGLVIESHIESKRGASATLIIKNGELGSGQFVVAGAAFAPVRIMENFLGKPVKTAHAGQPVRIVGFSALPTVGATFTVATNKKEAEALAQNWIEEGKKRAMQTAEAAPAEEQEQLVIPIIIKTDAAGTGDAVAHEIAKLPPMERLQFRTLSQGVGAVSEADVKLVGSGETPGIVLGFNVKVDDTAKSLAERLEVTIATFDIIYRLAEWLATEAEKRRPRQRVEESVGRAKILKVFSQTKKNIVLGGRIEEGVLEQGSDIRIMRRDLDLGRGTIESLQSQKSPAKKVEAGNEFGAMIRTDSEIAAGDHIESFIVVTK
ncbi:MAG TPA: translation initiation factor IF-2 [Candidatus Paceibacterota bacterium]